MGDGVVLVGDLTYCPLFAGGYSSVTRCPQAAPLGRVLGAELSTEPLPGGRAAAPSGSRVTSRTPGPAAADALWREVGHEHGRQRRRTGRLRERWSISLGTSRKWGATGAPFEVTMTVGVITGAGSGMGRACVALLRDAVDRLVAVDLVDPEIPGTVGVPCDVADPCAVRTLVGRVREMGPFRLLAHAAGLSPSMADARRIVEVNLLGTVHEGEGWRIPGTKLRGCAALEVIPWSWVRRGAAQDASEGSWASLCRRRSGRRVSGGVCVRISIVGVPNWRWPSRCGSRSR